MPFDPFFRSDHRKGHVPEWRRRALEVKAKHKARWPPGSNFEKKVSLEMRTLGQGWWTFLWVGESEAQEELRRWRVKNPRTLFRIGEQ
jgi:hypothetical protein